MNSVNELPDTSITPCFYIIFLLFAYSFIIFPYNSDFVIFSIEETAKSFCLFSSMVDGNLGSLLLFVFNY